MRILVTGATGNIGRMVVDELVDAGAHVRALTVDPARAGLPTEVEVAVGYVGDPATLAPALDGVERMYLAPAPETVSQVVPMAAEAGVGRIVDLSGEEGSWWHAVAAAVEGAGTGWTHLWPGEFMENSLVWADQIKASCEVREAHPRAANAPIAMSDVAMVAAECLLGDGHDRRSYSLTGPESLSRADMIRLIGEAVGHNVRCVEVTPAEGIEALTPSLGEYAGWYVDGIAELVDHPQAAVATVADVTGRPATCFADWAVAHAHRFRRDSAPKCFPA